MLDWNRGFDRRAFLLWSRKELLWKRRTFDRRANTTIIWRCISHINSFWTKHPPRDINGVKIGEVHDLPPHYAITAFMTKTDVYILWHSTIDILHVMCNSRHEAYEPDEASWYVNHLETRTNQSHLSTSQHRFLTIFQEKSYSSLIE